MKVPASFLAARQSAGIPTTTNQKNKKQSGGFAFFGYFFGEAKK
jgi:hypothetical protein